MNLIPGNIYQILNDNKICFFNCYTTSLSVKDIIASSIKDITIMPKSKDIFMCIEQLEPLHVWPAYKIIYKGKILYITHISNKEINEAVKQII